MKRIDFNCFCGTWPFHKIAHPEFEDLRRIHEENGIEGGFISSTHAIFYNDPYEADLELAKTIRGTRYRQVMTVNPMLPAWRDDIHRAIHDLDIAGVRIHPGYHGYTILDKCMKELMELLRKLNLPLFLTMRMEDERATYLLHPEQVTWAQVGDFILRYPENVILLCNFRMNELRAIQEQIKACKNVYADCSGIKDGVFALETICEEYGLEDRLVYGSLCTISCLKSTILTLETAKVDPQIVERIFAGEAMMGLIKQPDPEIALV